MNAERAAELEPPARVLGFDFGQRRIGVAAGQAFTGTAQALTVVPNGPGGPDWVRLDALVREWRPDALVVGKPLTLSGEEQAASQAARGFSRQLQKRFGLAVHAQDERLSSREADQRFAEMRRSGQKRARDAAQLDALAAQVIVEDFYAGWGGARAMQVDAEQALQVLGQALSSVLQARAISAPRLVGIHTGGVWVAERLQRALGIAAPLGTLDISFHRDDYGQVGLNPVVRPSHLPWDVTGADLVLVDDVLYTGRTIRAALNEVFDWGRPRSVLLAVLVARDGRELPIAADAVGAGVEVGPEHQLKLRGPEPLRLELTPLEAR